MAHTKYLHVGQIVKVLVLVYWFIFCELTKVCEASSGDNNAFYRRCVDQCKKANCSYDGTFLLSEGTSFLISNLWSCQDDCCYKCMWDTVNSFKERSWETPQFHGKWPFVRILGLQEPASVVFSLMNLFSHLFMLHRFREQIRKSSPMYFLWHVYALVCLNCWFWSAAFHTRDVPFTEKMDYFCAFSMVLISFYSMALRVMQGRSVFASIVLTIICILLFIHHVTYLTLVHFDYSYNMFVNIFVGAMTVVGWLIWCAFVYKHQSYVWRCAAFSILTALSVCFEIMDFPPIFWVIDAHSLFHLGTAGLPLLFYRFLIDDCKYLHKQMELERDETFSKKKK